jgi:glycosyltransferase involved in cell wall biosynthesis
MMNILLSAYACEPNKGSEAEVGWEWAVNLAATEHRVWVVTRANNREPIEGELRQKPPLGSLSFLFYDLPDWLRRWKSGRRGLYVYYLLWQWGAYRLAKREHRRVRFDLVHHVTLANIRLPSFMGRLRIPFILGPVAGGEAAPLALRRGYGWKGFVRDALRDISNFLIAFDPLVRATLGRATRIYVTSEQTRSLVPTRFRSKTAVRLAIGYDHTPPACVGAHERREEPSLLFVGEFRYLKGMHLALPAFALLLTACPQARLTLIGRGPAEKEWRRLARSLGIAERLTWMPWISRQQLVREYLRHDIFLFPSLHDSGGFVVLEALSAGLPVVCLNLGGPGIIVNHTCGRIVAVRPADRDAVIRQLAEEIRQLLTDENLRHQLSMGARERVREFGWRRSVDNVYAPANLRTLMASVDLHEPLCDHPDQSSATDVNRHP